MLGLNLLCLRRRRSRSSRAWSPPQLRPPTEGKGAAATAAAAKGKKPGAVGAEHAVHTERKTVTAKATNKVTFANGDAKTKHAAATKREEAVTVNDAKRKTVTVVAASTKGAVTVSGSGKKSGVVVRRVGASSPPAAVVKPQMPPPPPPPRARSSPEQRGRNQQQLLAMSSGRAMAPAPPLPVTEDTPPDMLAGSMDLRVVLPGGRAVKMSAERCTPMMDLLVQITTANKMAPGGFVLQPFGERGVLPYKPSTPIGALDTWQIQIVPKARTLSTTSLKKAPLKPNNQQPFEQTFRLQVHLPRNQLFVTRISPKCVLSDVLKLACTEKNLDHNKYELRHPANLEERLKPEWTLADYKLQEVTLVAKGNRHLGSGLSSSDIMALQKEEEKRRQQVKANGANGSTVLGLMLGKNSQSSGCDGSISSDSLGGRSISPSRSDETPSPPGSSLPPPRPIRKRRPAPKPPTQATQSLPTPQAIISHSRNSSDSSGYHEASILSESPESNGLSSPSGTLPRRSKLPNSSTQPPNVAASHNLSRSLSNLTHMSNGEHKSVPFSSSMQKNGHSASTTSLTSSGFGKKKKAAPPPPPPTIGKSLPGHLLPDQRTASLSTLSSQSSADSFEREIYSRSATLERPPSSQSSTTSSFMRHESVPEETTVIEENEFSPQCESIGNIPKTLSPELHSAVVSKNEIETEKSQPLDRILQIKAEPVHQNLAQTQNSNAYIHPPLVEENVSYTKLQEKIPIPAPNDESSRIIIESCAPGCIQPNNEASIPTVNVVAPPRTILPDVVSDLEKNGDDFKKKFENRIQEFQPEEPKEIVPVIFQNPKTESPIPSLVDWEYPIPAPPSAFRDSQSPTLTRTTHNPSENSEDSFVINTNTEVLPPAEFIDNDKPTRETETHLNSLMIVKECPLIQSLVKGVMKVNPLFDDEKYEAEMVKVKEYVKEDSQSLMNGIGEHSKNKDDWKPQQLPVDTFPIVQSKEHEKNINCLPYENQSSHLTNFTISTYQRSRDVDILFAESDQSQKDDTEFKKPCEPMLFRRKDSAGSNLLRNNSFSTKNNSHSERTTVKRSTSHASVNNSGRTLRAKSIGNLAMETSRDECGCALNERMEERHEGLRKTTSEANISQDYGRSSRLAELQDQFLQWQEQLLRQTQPDIPLQSLQVLRRILSPSQDSSREKIKDKFSDDSSLVMQEDASSTLQSSENLDSSEVSNKITNDVQLRRLSSSLSNSHKRYSYHGPPAVNFSTWSERPKSQVSIKVDNDYRIGKGQNSTGLTNNVEKKMSEDQIDSQDNSGILTRSEGLTHINGHSKIEPTALTMRIVSRTTPTVYKKSSSPFSANVADCSHITDKEPIVSSPVITRVHTYNSAQMADPSRVPIVRAVELKKSVLQQNVNMPERKPCATNVKLSWNEGNSQNARTSHDNGNNGIKDDNTEERFQGVNNLAKRFSFATSNSDHVKYNHSKIRPVSAHINNSSKAKLDAEIKKVENNVKESNGLSNGNKPMITKKYTSIVGVNGVDALDNIKELSQVINRPAQEVLTSSSVQRNGSINASKSTSSSNARYLMPVVKGFRYPTNDYSDSSLVAAESYKVSPNLHQSVTVKIQQSNSFSNHNQRNSVVIEPSPTVNLKIQPMPTSKSSFNGSQPSPQPPSAPVLPKKIQPVRQKSFHTPEVNVRDQLMDAIRNFGGREKLRQVAPTSNNILVII